MPFPKELKSEIKNLLTEEGLGPALKGLKAALPEDSKAFNEALLLEAELKEVNLKMVRGSISQTDLDVKYNSLRERLLELLDSLEEEDLDPARSGKDAKQGSLLYQIPAKMELEKETRCRVRIAWDEETLLENIELTSDTKVKDVRIAEVMQVEIIDPAETPAFSIRTYNSEEQFVDKEEFTEWLFFVKPLREGQFPLLLRVSVIEKVGEKERAREIVMEESVVIVAAPVEEAGEASFKASGIVVGGEAEEMPKKKASKRKPLQAAALALVGLMAFSGITYAALPAVRMNVDWVIATALDTPEAYQAFAEKYEGKSLAKKALEKLEQMSWNEVETVPETPLTENSMPEGTMQAVPEDPDLHPGGNDTEEVKKETRVSTSTTTTTSVNKPADSGNKPAEEKAKVKIVIETTTPTDSKPEEEKPVVKPAPVPVPNKMIHVKGGTFTMGCSDGQGSDCESDENPAHQVTVKDFWIGKYEVTQAEWWAVMGSQPPSLQFESCDACPVEGVSWNDVQEFIKKLNRQTGENYRLPTEAEWEYAARGGANNKGYKYAGSDDLDEVGWYIFNANRTKPVGQKAANELGIHDMCGNVGEWCADWYGVYPFAAQTDPAGPASGSRRVLRGGTWAIGKNSCRVSNRINQDPDSRLNDYGFRLAKD